jgi:hypothetical protein
VKDETIPDLAVTTADQRPALPDSGTCFYCRQSIGTPHARNCVLVIRRVRLRVLLDGVVLGTWDLDQPCSWDAYQIESHKNESSWCAGNFLDEEDISTTTLSIESWATLKSQAKETNLPDSPCLCECGLMFEFDQIVNDVPRVRREP